MRWPWQARKQITAERQEAEARAEQVHRELTMSFREMRHENHLTQAVFDDIRRNLKREGS